MCRSQFFLLKRAFLHTGQPLISPPTSTTSLSLDDEMETTMVAAGVGAVGIAGGVAATRVAAGLAAGVAAVRRCGGIPDTGWGSHRGCGCGCGCSSGVGSVGRGGVGSVSRRPVPLLGIVFKIVFIRY